MELTLFIMVENFYFLKKSSEKIKTREINKQK